MVGGTKPVANILKNINLLEGNMAKYLNPFYGFVWAESAIVNNIFMSGDNDSMSKMIRASYADIPGGIQPVKPLFVNEGVKSYVPVTNRDLGRYLGKKYLQMEEQDRYTELKRCLKIVNAVELKLSQIKSLEDNNQLNNIDKKKNAMLTMINDLNKCKKESTEFSEYNYELFMSVVADVKALIDERLSRYTIDNNTIDFFIDKHWSNDCFKVVLSIVWYKADNKHGIRDYYEGLNEIIPITIPDDFVDIIARPDDETDYYEQIVQLFHANKGKFQINTQEYAYVYNAQKPNYHYPDCGASALRTFLRLWLSNDGTGVLDIDRLKEKTSNENLITYFTVFNTHEKQMSKEKHTIFDMSLNARNAWTYVVSNLSDDITYIRNCNMNDGSCMRCEIKAKIPNVKKLIATLFDKVDDLEYESFDFDNEAITGKYNDYFNVGEITYTDLSKNFGSFDVNSGIYGTYTWHFIDGHTYFDKEIDNEEFDYSNEDPELQFYILLFSKSMYQILNEWHTYPVHWYKYFDFTNHNDVERMYKKMTGQTKRNIEELQLTNNITPELYNEITKLVITHLKSDVDALGRLIFLPEINKENLILYFKLMFNVITDNDNNIIELGKKEFDGRAQIKTENIYLLTHLKTLYIPQNMYIISLFDTKDIETLYINSVDMLMYLAKGRFRTLYIDDIEYGDYEEYEIKDQFKKFTNLRNLYIGPNVVLNISVYQPTQIVKFIAHKINDSLAGLPNTIHEIELKYDTKNNWSGVMKMPYLKTIIVHNMFSNSQRRIKIKNRNKVDVVSDLTNVDVDDYYNYYFSEETYDIDEVYERFLYDQDDDVLNYMKVQEIIGRNTQYTGEEREKRIKEELKQLYDAHYIQVNDRINEERRIHNRQINFKILYDAYLKHNDVPGIHAYYLKQLLTDIINDNNIIRFDNLDVIYNDDNIVLTIDNEVYTIHNNMTIEHNGETHNVRKCNHNEPIIKMLCKITKNKGKDVFLPPIKMQREEYE